MAGFEKVSGNRQQPGMQVMARREEGEAQRRQSAWRGRAFWARLQPRRSLDFKMSHYPGATSLPPTPPFLIRAQRSVAPNNVRGSPGASPTGTSVSALKNGFGRVSVTDWDVAASLRCHKTMFTRRRKPPGLCERSPVIIHRPQRSIPTTRIRSEITRTAVSDPNTFACNANSSALGACASNAWAARRLSERTASMAIFASASA